jgi:DNA uptake protein ComE-like DNA-binding protein
MRKRGSILLAVMVVLTLAALVGTTVLYRADAQRGSAATAMERAQLRALVWSGVQGAMAELAGQRGELMDGAAPHLTASWDLYTGTTRGNIRLTPMGSGGELAVSEGGKVDANIADAAMLGRLEGVGETLAGKIAGARGAGFGSPEELASVEGLSAETLFGEAGPAPDQSKPESAPSESEGAPALLSMLTVFSFDPNTTIGIGASASGDELARLNVSGGWTDGLEADLKDRVSAAAAASLQIVLKVSKPAKDSDLVAGLIQAKVPEDQWGEILGGVTTSDDAYRRGRIDLNTASAAVLASVPGIDRPAADKIVEARARIDATSKKLVTWPLKEGILKEAQFQSAADWITTRSLQWRIRVEARLERVEQSTTSSRDEEAAVPPGMVWEAVIDVSGTRPRVAYLRDVTYLATLVQQAKEQEKAGPLAALAGQAADAPGAGADLPDLTPGKLDLPNSQPSTGPKTDKPKLGSDLHFDGMQGSGSLDMNTDLKLSGTGDLQPAAALETSPQGDGEPKAAKDRRIGRWRTPSKE